MRNCYRTETTHCKYCGAYYQDSCKYDEHQKKLFHQWQHWYTTASHWLATQCQLHKLNQ